MNENVLVANLLAVIKAGLSARSISVGIKQAYQPTQQGAPVAPMVFLSKVSETEYGFPERLDAWDAVSSTVKHTEKQWLKTTFQVNARATQDPSDTTQLTSGDYVKAVARILGSDAAILGLSAFGIGIERIQKLRNIYFTDERGQYQASPSFDFTVSYQNIEVTLMQSTASVIATVTIV